MVNSEVHDLRDTPGEAPRYTAGCYAVPIRFMYGTAAEINFWDVVYYGAHLEGGEVDTSTAELVEQVGVTRQMIGSLCRKAMEHGALVRDESWKSGRRFALRIPGFKGLRKGMIWKPLGYVRNGWHRTVKQAIAKRVLNVYFQQPRQQAYQLNPGYLAAKCIRQFPFDDYTTVAPVNLADIGDALRLLVRLGLLASEGNGFRIDWAAFDQPAADTSAATPDPRAHRLFTAAYVTDPNRANRALELLESGNYDMESHFREIFRDMAYVTDEGYPSLKAKVRKRRKRPPSPHRWHDAWKAFLRDQQRHTTEIRSRKVILRLDREACVEGPLALDLVRGIETVLYVQAVARVAWPWNAQEKAVIQLELRSSDHLLCARTIDSDDAVVRCSLHPEVWAHLTQPLIVRAQSDRPRPGVHTEVWLEAGVRR